MTHRLAGKTAIITGATSGIGAATALLFAQQGAKLVLTGRRASLGNDIAARCTQTGASCTFVEADHTSPADCQRVVDVAVEQFGGVDILFNNAGIVPRGTAETTDESVWQATIDINITAVWRMSRLVLPLMRRQRSGTIINNGSDWSVVGGANALAYVMSKGAVALMTKAMALDHAHEGIRVNAVCPGDTLVERWRDKLAAAGGIDAAMHELNAHIPMQRFAQPEEVARAVLFLASEDSSYVTGHLLLVDGGSTAQ